MLPNFLVIGAMKAGTTSLWHYLRSHPQVFVTTPKEPMYFSEDALYGHRAEWYSSLFWEGREAVARGECSTTYAASADYPLVAPRIAATVPDVKIVYMVRQPMQRMRSQYLHSLYFGTLRTSFEAAVREDPRLIDRSRYGWHLDLYRQYLPADRILVLPSEQLRSDRAHSLRRLFRFLGVAPDAADLAADREHNRAKRVPRDAFSNIHHALLDGPPLARAGARLLGPVTTRPAAPADTHLSQESVKRLEDVLAPDVCRLREIVGAGEFDSWGWRFPIDSD
ncbi:MAG: sulfotransferase [Acidimicrobiales bacterium]